MVLRLQFSYLHNDSKYDRLLFATSSQEYFNNIFRVSLKNFTVFNLSSINLVILSAAIYSLSGRVMIILLNLNSSISSIESAAKIIEPFAIVSINDPGSIILSIITKTRALFIESKIYLLVSIFNSLSFLYSFIILLNLLI